MVDDKCMIDDEWTIILSQVNRINQPEMRIRLDLFGIVTPCEHYSRDVAVKLLSFIIHPQ